MARAPKKQAKPMTEGTLASRIAQRFATAGGELALDRLVSEFGDEQRYDVVAALKELEKTGAGTFEVGRAGRKARFLWSGKPPKVAKVIEKEKPAAKPSVAAKPATKGTLVSKDAGTLQLSQRVKLAQRPLAATPTVTAGGKELEHQFHLRPGFTASVRLPVDVTSSEVARFCQFLQAIPFGKG